MKIIKHLVMSATIALATTTADAQNKTSSFSREEFITVDKQVKLHVTDWGEGKPVVLIHGWPLSDAMYEYQYQFLVEKGYRVIGITLRGRNAHLLLPEYSLEWQYPGADVLLFLHAWGQDEGLE